MRKANGDHFNGSVGGHFKDQVSDVHFNGSAGVNSQGAHDDGPSVLAPTWSVRETRRQFEQMGTGPAMSNSFSGDLRHYKGRYAAPLAEAEKQRSADPNNVLSFDSIKLNEGHSTTGRRRSNDEHLNRYHPHNHPMSHNFQQAVQNQHVPNNGFNTVAQYYPKPAQSNDFSPLPPNSFQAPRLISQTNSVSASRPATYTSPPVTVHHPDYNNELRGHTAPDHPTSSNWSQSNDMHSRKTPEIRTVVAVPETDILDDSNHSEAEDDDIVATCADENHTKDDSINFNVNSSFKSA